MNNILEYIGMAFILIGGIFLFLGALGIYRMPDVYTRLQAGTKSSTLGAMSTIIGVGFLHPDWFLKIVLIVVFIGLANPLSSHALARASYRKGIKPKLKSGVGSYKKAMKKQIKKFNS
ncbi:MAG: monovalent cation/H(+) antiporter subunit G [Flavobacteriaceae bacterium]|nr:monovalent cation/H(+) antiporter subunit G [Flavobacteriaceae bacterium]